jgi:hypothetical protein
MRGAFTRFGFGVVLRKIARLVGFIAVLTSLAACSTKKPPRPLPNGPQTATLNLTYGNPVVGIVPMPPGFVPNTAYPPLWLGQENEIGIVGSSNGEIGVLGFSGAGLSNRQVIAADSALQGHLLDVAASPDGATLALAVARPAQNRLEVIARTGTNPAGDRSMAIVDGNFDSAELTWLNPTTLALLLLPPPTANQQVAPGSIVLSSGGLYIIKAGVPIQRLDGVQCPLSPLSFSPDGRFAVGQGDAAAPPVLVDLHNQNCRPLGPRIPLKVLAWAHDSSGFLFAAHDPEGVGNDVLRYDRASGQSVLVARSSAAAAYTDDGTIVTLGSRELSARRLANQPQGAVKAEIALMKPAAAEITVNSLGFETLPAMLAASTMVFSIAADEGVIDTAIIGDARIIRELIAYSYKKHAAFVLANGAAASPVLISWSPDGKMLAIVDGDANSSTLAVIAPPG